MIIPREAESAGQAGATRRAPGRRAAARSLPRLAAAVSMVGAVTVLGPANHTDGPADAAAARSHATAMAAGTAAASRPRSGLTRAASGAYLPSGAATARMHSGLTGAASRNRSGLTGAASRNRSGLTAAASRNMSGRPPLPAGTGPA